MFQPLLHLKLTQESKLSSPVKFNVVMIMLALCRRNDGSVEWSTLSRSRAPVLQASRHDAEDDEEEDEEEAEAEEEQAMDDDGGDRDEDGMPEMKSRRVPAIVIKPKKGATLLYFYFLLLRLIDI